MKQLIKIKDKLCTIEDCLTMIFTRQEVSDRTKNALMKARADIDNCVYELEKVIKSLTKTK